MSELGQNEGQEQDKNVPFFDSAKITDKKDVEHFSNVEGAEERAKKAEQAKKAAEKEAKEVHAADVRAASEQMKRQETESSGKKGGIAGFLFGGWHKFVTIGILLLCCALVIVACLVHKNNEQEKTKKEASAVYAEALKVADYDSYNPDYYLGEKVITDAIESSANDEEKALLRVALARYYKEMYGDFDRAISMLDELDTEYGVKSNNDCFTLETLNIVYSVSNRTDELKNYIERLEKSNCEKGELREGI